MKKVTFINKKDKNRDKVYTYILTDIKIDINPENDMLVGYDSYNSGITLILKKIYYKDIKILNKKEDYFVKSYMNKLIDEYHAFLNRINSHSFRQKYFILNECEDYDAITPEYYDQLEDDCPNDSANYFESDLNDCINMLNIKSPTVINLPSVEHGLNNNNIFNFNLE